MWAYRSGAQLHFNIRYTMASSMAGTMRSMPKILTSNLSTDKETEPQCVDPMQNVCKPIYDASEGAASEISDILQTIRQPEVGWCTEPRVRSLGMAVLREPHLYKGMAYSIRERQLLGIHGLIPPRVQTQEEQVAYVMQNLKHFSSDLDKYIFLMGLQDRNEKLFYRVLSESPEEMMPLVYTPTVGLACQKFGLVFRRPRGIFITIHDLGHVYEILSNWPVQEVKAIVVTDGERILGLGDLGAYGMGIPIGKLSLYTALAGVNPQHCLPVLLDVGTDRQTLLDDPLYIGLKHKRVRGEKYDALIKEFFEAVIEKFGQDTLIQFEDFGNRNAFRLLEDYRKGYCTFNDDIQGTAAVAVAGVLSSLRVTKTQLKDNRFLFQGAGEASIGIATLLTMAMMESGLSEKEALSKIFMVDSKGLIVKNRPTGGISEHKARFAQAIPHLEGLENIVEQVKPSVLVGAAAQPGVFTEKLLRDMGTFNQRPVIFALSNPTSKAECTAEAAYKHTEGRAIFASGSPFAPVTLNGKTFYPGQGNNAYIFPGVGLAVIAAKVRNITDGVFLKSAQALASMVTHSDLSEGRLYPPLANIQEVSTQVAVETVKYAYKQGLANFFPEPKDKDCFIRSRLYSTDYSSLIPEPYQWPEAAYKK